MAGNDFSRGISPRAGQHDSARAVIATRFPISGNGGGDGEGMRRGSRRAVLRDALWYAAPMYRYEDIRGVFLEIPRDATRAVRSA